MCFVLVGVSLLPFQAWEMGYIWLLLIHFCMVYIFCLVYASVDVWYSPCFLFPPTRINFGRMHFPTPFHRVRFHLSVFSWDIGKFGTRFVAPCDVFFCIDLFLFMRICLFSVDFAVCVSCLYEFFVFCFVLLGRVVIARRAPVVVWCRNLCVYCYELVCPDCILFYVNFYGFVLGGTVGLATPFVCALVTQILCSFETSI